ncbi:ferredoxin [Pseudonocardia spinosispora]|uniref:ferredoxin n=1 Tax=Pseudonocardia spinosispora TaxID=103441 RepID=UPI000413954E|nr:ferredoxin [Pseudonocardia spinosispora]
MRVQIDTGLCTGHGQCEANAPEVFALDDRGFAVTPDAELPAGLAEEARFGAQACPERAITVHVDER